MACLDSGGQVVFMPEVAYRIDMSSTCSGYIFCQRNGKSLVLATAPRLEGFSVPESRAHSQPGQTAVGIGGPVFSRRQSRSPD